MFAITVTVEWEITGGVGRCPVSGFLESLLGTSNLGDLKHANSQNLAQGAALAIVTISPIWTPLTWSNR